MTRSRPPLARVASATHHDTALAAEVQSLVEAGQAQAARDRYGELVGRHQRRAVRVAYWYLRDVAEADEAVQDAFVKAFTHLAEFDVTRAFDVWFTRILVNGCLDRLKTRGRRARWLVSATEGDGTDHTRRVPSAEASPEVLLLRRERGARLRNAVERLPARQRAVVALSHFEGHTTREVSEVTGLSEATVRVHLFRGLRRLRQLLAADPVFAAGGLGQRSSTRSGTAS